MKSGRCPSDRPSAWLVIAWANSCNTHRDGVRSASRIDSRLREQPSQWPSATAERPPEGSANPCPTRSHRTAWASAKGRVVGSHARRDFPRHTHGDAAGPADRSGELSQRIARHRTIEVHPITRSPARTKRRSDHPATHRAHTHQPDVRLAEGVLNHAIFGEYQRCAG